MFDVGRSTLDVQRSTFKAPRYPMDFFFELRKGDRPVAPTTPNS